MLCDAACTAQAFCNSKLHPFTCCQYPPMNTPTHIGYAMKPFLPSQELWTSSLRASYRSCIWIVDVKIHLECNHSNETWMARIPYNLPRDYCIRSKNCHSNFWQGKISVQVYSDRDDFPVSNFCDKVVIQVTQVSIHFKMAVWIGRDSHRRHFLSSVFLSSLPKALCSQSAMYH